MLAGLSSAAFSQTKRIAHRSHSGSNSSFTIQAPDNFGETPEMIEAARKKKEQEKMKADSIAKRAIADSIARIPKYYKKKKNKSEKSKSGSKSE